MSKGKGSEIQQSATNLVEGPPLPPDVMETIKHLEELQWKWIANIGDRRRAGENPGLG